VGAAGGRALFSAGTARSYSFSKVAPAVSISDFAKSNTASRNKHNLLFRNRGAYFRPVAVVYDGDEVLGGGWIK